MFCVKILKDYKYRKRSRLKENMSCILLNPILRGLQFKQVCPEYPTREQFVVSQSIGMILVVTPFICMKYYNKEYREAFPREFLLPAAVEMHRTPRVRCIPTTKGSKNSRGTLPPVFLYFIYRSRPLMILKYVKTYQNNRP